MFSPLVFINTMENAIKFSGGKRSLLHKLSPAFVHERYTEARRFTLHIFIRTRVVFISGLGSNYRKEDLFTKTALKNYDIMFLN